MKFKKIFFSLKFSAILIFLLVFFLFLNVFLPQERVLGKEKIKEIVGENSFLKFFFYKLNFKDITSSPLFFLILLLFYLQLIFFIFRYFKLTLKRIKIKEPNFKNWKSLKIKGEIEEIKNFLKEKSWKEFQIKENKLYYVINELSPLGFLFFHFSFLLYLLSGFLLYYTRSEKEFFLALNQTVSLEDESWVLQKRKPKIKESLKNLKVYLKNVNLNLYKEEPLLFKTEIVLWHNNKMINGNAEINKPFKYKTLKVYPVFQDDAFLIQVEDKEGYIIEKPIIFSNCSKKIGSAYRILDKIEGEIGCEKVPYLNLSYNGKKEKLQMIEGREINFGDIRVKIIKKVPWVKFRAINESGSFPLFLGFILSILGLIFRFLFPNREIVISNSLIYYKADYFPSSLKELIEKFCEVKNGAG